MALFYRRYIIRATWVIWDGLFQWVQGYVFSPVYALQFYVRYNFLTISIGWLDLKEDKIVGSQNKGALTEEDKFKFSDIKTFNKSFWLLSLSCVIVYVGIFPYIQVVSGMLQDRFQFSEETAGQLFGIPYIISACISPFLGFMIDKIGKRVLLSKNILKSLVQLSLGLLYNYLA